MQLHFTICDVFIYKLSNEWEYLDEKITAAWISSKNNFDKLYGVIRALYLSGISFEDLKADAEKRKEKQDSEKNKSENLSLERIRETNRTIEEIKVETAKYDAQIKLEKAKLKLSDIEESKS